MASILLGTRSYGYPYAGALFVAAPFVGALAAHVVRVVGTPTIQQMTPGRGAYFQLIGAVAVHIMRCLTPRNRISLPTQELVGSFLLTYAFFRLSVGRVSWSAALANTVIALLVTQLAVALLKDYRLIDDN